MAKILKVIDVPKEWKINVGGLEWIIDKLKCEENIIRTSSQLSKPSDFMLECQRQILDAIKILELVQSQAKEQTNEKNYIG